MQPPRFSCAACGHAFCLYRDYANHMQRDAALCAVELQRARDHAAVEAKFSKGA